MAKGVLKPIRAGKRKSRRTGYARISRGDGWIINQPKNPVQLPKRTMVFAGIILFLLLCITISEFNAIPIVFASPEYNGQNHTRTPILTHTTTNQPTPVRIGSYGPTSANAFVGMNTDGQGQGNCFLVTTGGALSSAVFAARLGNGAGPTGTMQVSVYTSTGTIGASTCIGFSRLAFSNAINFNQLTGSLQNFTFTFPSPLATVTVNQQVVIMFFVNGTFPSLTNVQVEQGAVPGTAQEQLVDFVTGAWNPTSQCGTGAQPGCRMFDLFSNQDFGKVRWSYNTTCVVTSSAGNYIKFDYILGTSGSGGSNCNSADVAMIKSPITLQTVSERMLEIDQAWVNEDVASHTLLSVNLFLRTNGTLPSFNEGYDPFNDPSVRMAWGVNPTYSASPGQFLFVAHDTGKSINQESQVNDLVISGTAPDFTQTSAIGLQAVLNYTGSVNLLEEAQTTNAPNRSNSTSVGQLQPSLNYYIGIKTYFDTTKTPAGADTKFGSGSSLGTPALPKSFEIFTVPALCQDPANANVAPCGSSPNPFNIFDPSTWAGAAVAGLGWIGNQAQGLLGAAGNAVLGLGNSVFGAIVSAIIQAINSVAAILPNIVTRFIGFIQAALNALGVWAGWGNIGDQFISFVQGVITYFTIGLGDALSWLLRLILRSIDLIKALNIWAGFYLTGLLNLLADLFNTVGFIVTLGTKITVFLGSSYVLILVLFFFWYDADMGLPGWHAWFETAKWFSFISYDILERMINFGISSITWLIGRLPTLDGTTLPELPTIAIGGGPIWPSMEMTALREGNIPSVFGMLIGMVFLIWFETSGLPGSIGSNVTGTAAGVMAPFVNVFLILLSVVGLLFILNIPAQLARKTFDLDNPLAGIRATPATFSTPVATGSVTGHIARRHPERHAKIVVHPELGISGLRPHLRKPKANNISRLQAQRAVSKGLQI